MMKVLRNILNHKPSSMDINSTSDKKQTYTSWTPTETEDISNIENNTNNENLIFWRNARISN